MRRMFHTTTASTKTTTASTKTRWLLALGGCTITLALGACGGTTTGSNGAANSSNGSNSSNAGGGGGTTGSIPACSKFTAATVNSALGTTVGEPASTGSGTIQTCTYADASGGSVTIYFHTTDQATFNTAISSLPGVTPLSGVGSAAFAGASQSDATVMSVYAFNNGLEVSVTAVASQAKIQALVITILS